MKFVIPGEPKAKGRHRTSNGHSYTPDSTVLYENWIKQCFISSENKERLEGQIEAHIKAFFSIPKSTSKTKRSQMLSGEIRPTKKPDTDNIAKCVLDACNNLAYKDDSQIVKLVVEKYYGDDPRLEVDFNTIIF